MLRAVHYGLCLMCFPPAFGAEIRLIRQKPLLTALIPFREKLSSREGNYQQTHDGTTFCHKHRILAKLPARTENIRGNYEVLGNRGSVGDK